MRPSATYPKLVATMAPASSAVSSSYQRLASPAVTKTSATPANAAHRRAAVSPGPVTVKVAAVSQ
ncbi:MAG: hypothetical protein R2708_15335 [Vicinamibacterales bacterium]